jgi:hypothetical protein
MENNSHLINIFYYCIIYHAKKHADKSCEYVGHKNWIVNYCKEVLHVDYEKTIFYITNNFIVAFNDFFGKKIYLIALDILGNELEYSTNSDNFFKLFNKDMNHFFECCKELFICFNKPIYIKNEEENEKNFKLSCTLSDIEDDNSDIFVLD